MYLHVFPERARVGVTLVASPDLTVVRFVGRVDVRMFLPIAGVRKPSVAPFEFAFKRFLACVCSLVDFQIF